MEHRHETLTHSLGCIWCEFLARVYFFDRQVLYQKKLIINRYVLNRCRQRVNECTVSGILDVTGVWVGENLPSHAFVVHWPILHNIWFWCPRQRAFSRQTPREKRSSHPHSIEPWVTKCPRIRREVLARKTRKIK